MQPTVRIDLGDEDYAVILKELRHKTSRLINQLLRQSLGITEYQILDDKLRNALNEKEKRDILRKVPLEGEDEIILLNQIVEWSFGEINQESLDNIPASKYQKLTEGVDKLYSQPPLVIKN